MEKKLGITSLANMVPRRCVRTTTASYSSIMRIFQQRLLLTSFKRGLSASELEEVATVLKLGRLRIYPVPSPILKNVTKTPHIMSRAMLQATLIYLQFWPSALQSPSTYHLNRRLSVLIKKNEEKYSKLSLMELIELVEKSLMKNWDDSTTLIFHLTAMYALPSFASVKDLVTFLLKKNYACILSMVNTERNGASLVV